MGNHVDHVKYGQVGIISLIIYFIIFYIFNINIPLISNLSLFEILLNLFIAGILFIPITLMPDIDTYSRFSRFFLLGISIITIITFVLYYFKITDIHPFISSLVINLLGVILITSLKHRGLTHSLITAIPITYIISYFIIDVINSVFNTTFTFIILFISLYSLYCVHFICDNIPFKLSLKTKTGDGNLGSLGSIPFIIIIYMIISYVIYYLMNFLLTL